MIGRSLPAAAIALAILAACGGARSGPASPQTTGSVAITNVTVIDVVRGVALPRMTVVTAGGRIATVAQDGRSPRGATRVDGTGRFLIPGLWDMHTHHQASGADSLPLFPANGVVGTRDMGSDLEFILSLRARVASGELLGPTIVAAGPMLDDAPPDWPWRRRVADAGQGAAMARVLKASGVDFLKVHDNTPRDAYFAIAEEAKRQGLAFAGHVPRTVTVAEAAEAGQASIEHLANFRVFLECSGDNPYRPEGCAALFDLLAAKGVWQTPTLAFFETVPEMFSGAAPPSSDYAAPSLRDVWRRNRRHPS